MQLIIYVKRTWELIKAREKVMTITTKMQFCLLLQRQFLHYLSLQWTSNINVEDFFVVINAFEKVFL